LNSDAFNGVNATATLTIIESPCQTATARLYDPDDPNSIAPPDSIWEPNGEFWRVDVVTSGTVAITGVFQDEPVRNGADARFIDGDSDSVELSAEREGNGDGRIYHVFFSVDLGPGLSCDDGELLVPVVEHDQSGEISGDPSDFDGGALYDSTIAPKSDPVANDDPVSTDEDNPVSGNVLANDIPGKPNDLLTVTAVNGFTGTVGISLTLASGAVVDLAADGSFVYDPNGQFESLADGAVESDTFSYTLIDGDGASDTAIVTVAVSGLNDAPVALDDPADLNTSASPEVTISVTSNDTDVDSGLNLSSLTVMSPTISGPISGTATIIGDGAITYTPDEGFVGQDSFVYAICDTEGACDSATVTVNVTAVNRPPVANDDTASLDTSVGMEVTIAVAANDTDADGNLDPSSVTVASPPMNGTTTSNDDGTVTYAPNDAGSVGQDSFIYEICDFEGVCDSATVIVNLTASGNRFPIAVDDRPEEAPQGTSLTIDVLANDEDPDGDTLTVSEVTQGGRGSVIPNPDGTVTYTPGSNFKGEDSFSYTVIDNRGGMDTATVTVMFGGK
jgi:VCBS repeat-containing protein